ncbi:MAG: hypothetical protein HC797_02525 [Anaerolineales bacterium]|nr:hypothetical protein [Anaerolineales bacterium]
MELKTYLETLYDYNYWANKRYVAVAETLTEEQLFYQHGHSWESVHAILVHMMSSERMWPNVGVANQLVFWMQKIFQTLNQ